MPDPIATAADFVRLLEVQVQQHLDASRLTLTRYATLSRADGASGSDLARQVGVTQQMVSKTVAELRLLSYVTSIPSHDRRRQVLQLTARGRTALDQARALHLPADLVTAMQAYVSTHTTGAARALASPTEGTTP